jgi:hypothetical protein
MKKVHEEAVHRLVLRTGVDTSRRIRQPGVRHPCSPIPHPSSSIFFSHTQLQHDHNDNPIQGSRLSQCYLFQLFWFLFVRVSHGRNDLCSTLWSGSWRKRGRRNSKGNTWAWSLMTMKKMKHTKRTEESQDLKIPTLEVGIFHDWSRASLS